MKKFKIVSAALILLAGSSIDVLAQSPTIQREVRLVSPTGGAGFVGLKAAAGTSSYTLSMPTATPTANQVLTASSISGGAVTLSWNSPDASGWSLAGNAGTTSSNFLGTTDAQPFVLKTNGSTRMTVAAGGGITMNSLAGLSGTLSGSTTSDGVVVADGNGLISKASYSSVVSVGLSSSTNGLTIGGPLTVSGLFTANGGAVVAGGLSLTATSPLQLNGSVGNPGEILQSNGEGASPSWSSAYVKGRGIVSVTENDSIAVAASSVDANDAINVTLEGVGNNMAIPSYYVVRTASTGFTIYFSAPFTGSCNWSVINQ
jgi:hypothetical protein